jgi:phosphoglycolate phosphatase
LTILSGLCNHNHAAFCPTQQKLLQRETKISMVAFSEPPSSNSGITAQAVIFDLDGTLVDSSGDIAAACNYALAQTGRVGLSEEAICNFVGDGVRKLCARAAGLSMQEPELDQVVQLFSEYYRRNPTVHTQLVPQALRVMHLIEPMPMAICTNKSRDSAMAVLESLGIHQRFQIIIAGGDMPELKPSPAPVLAIAEHLDMSPHELVMVGDMPQDVLAGKQAGTRTVAVLSTFTSRERLVAARPDVIIERLAQLPEIIGRWAEATVRITLPKFP